jgi:hypothetical protein
MEAFDGEIQRALESDIRGHIGYCEAFPAGYA